jgi:hypothetical protein
MKGGGRRREMQPQTGKTKIPTPISQHAHTRNPSKVMEEKRGTTKGESIVSGGKR